MPHASPEDHARAINWRSRAVLPVAENDNIPGGGPCPVCGVLGPIAPAQSEYQGSGVIHHHWLCRACDHSWVTVMRVPQ